MTPVNVYPVLGVSVMIAVYTFEAAYGSSAGDHVTVPVYWPVAVIAVVGVSPVTGTVTPAIAASLIAVSPVAGGSISS